MQQLTFASRSLLTPDAVTEALFDLVASFDHGAPSETVIIPVLSDAGHLLQARLTLHASSELVAVADESQQQVEDEQAASAASDVAVAAIRERIRERAGHVERPALEEGPLTSSYEESYD